MADDGRSSRSSRRPKSSASRGSNAEDAGGDDITRCVCKKQDSTGVMVQCEKCLVWQHTACMMLNDAKLPEVYYCEQCAPQNHEKLLQQLRKRQTTPTARNEQPTPKKRMTINSMISEFTDPDAMAATSPSPAATPIKQEVSAPAPDQALSTPSGPPSSSTAPTSASAPSSSNKRAGNASSSQSAKRRAVGNVADPSSPSSAVSPAPLPTTRERDRRRDGRSSGRVGDGTSTGGGLDADDLRQVANKLSAAAASPVPAAFDGVDSASPAGFDSAGEDDLFPSGRSSRRRGGRGLIDRTPFHKDMTVPEMLRRARAMLDYLARSRRDLTQGGDLSDDEESPKPPPSEGAAECLKRIADLENRVVQFQRTYSKAAQNGNALS